MDVTYGLLTNLVKTKSIQKILAPIASQISLLIILNESEDDSTLQKGEMVPCAQAVVQASNKLAIVAKQQAHTSTDSEFIAQTLSSCEVLELSCTNLCLACERLEASGVSKEAKIKLIQASKDVLQGTMKVLLVADDAEIRRLVTSSHIVTEKLGVVCNVNDMPSLVEKFKEFTEALSVLLGLADKRQRDLIHSKQREKIITSLNILKKTVSSLSAAMQTFVKYSSNPQAQAGKTFVVNEILTSIRDIIEAAQNRDSGEEETVIEEPGKFVTNIDQALECVSEENREDLDGDLDLWVEEIVRHSMTVAHLCQDVHRDLIIKTCQRVIQVKNRVLDLKKNLTSDTILPQMREDFSDVCETLTDEFCELEKNVNVSLLHLVVEHFKETTEPLERLVKKAVYSHEVLSAEDPCVEDFEDHAEKICQVASLAAASSTDSNRVYAIQSSIQRLEHLDPEIIPAAMNLSRNKQDKAATRHLKLLMKEWTFELTNLIQGLDEMTDPKMFMLVSERQVEDDINSCNGSILIADTRCFTLLLQSMIGRSRRVVMVAERIVDAHNDAIFRNGLMVFVQQLKKAITAVRTAGANLGENLHDKTLQDTMRRRFTFLQDSLIKVKLGLNEANHPNVLSPLRRNVRGKRAQITTEVPSVKDKRLLKQRFTGKDAIIATSVPRLHIPTTPTEEMIVPRAESTQKSQPTMVKSLSLTAMSQTGPLKPQTYAWKLAQDLVTWCTKGDKQKVNVLCGSVLGWTNHIADVFTTVKPWCTDASKKSQMVEACDQVDELTPQLLEEAKYVLHGDFSALNNLKYKSDDWATKVEKVRVYVDITVDGWKTITDRLYDACKAWKKDLVKHQLKLLGDHVDALVSVSSVTEKFRWESQVKGQQLIANLLEDRNDLENLTVTLKTTSEMIVDGDSQQDLIELDQLGREWSVKVFAMVTQLDKLSDNLLVLAHDRKLWMDIEGCENLVEYLQDEAKKLKDLLKSACYGSEENKELYTGYLADMKDCVEEIKTVSIRKSSLTVATTQYSSTKLGLYRGSWILKGVQCIDLARQQTAMYCGSVDILIEGAFCLKAASVSVKAREDGRFKALQAKFTEHCNTIRRKVLHSIQLSSELEKRSMVRQCLDALNTLTPQVVTVIITFAGTTDVGYIGEVLYHRLLWSSKLKHLVTVLQQMSDVKTNLVPEILNVLESGSDIPDCDTVTRKLENAGTTTLSSPHVQQFKTSDTDNLHAKLDLNENVQSDNSLKSHDILKLEAVHSYDTVSGFPSKTIRQDQKTSNHSISGMNAGKQLTVDKLQKNDLLFAADSTITIETFDPVIVDMKSIEEQIILNARDISYKVEDLQIKEERLSTHSSPVKPRKDGVKPYMEMLRSAQYLERQTQRWEDENNPIVKVAQTMATQVSHMTQYIRRTGPINSHLGLVTTSKAVSDNARKILKFARVLVQNCVDERFCTNLKTHCSLVPTVIQQLAILSNIQLGTAKAEIADRILVENSQNLMQKILEMISECEAVCVKGLKSDGSQDAENALLLALQWKHKHSDYYKQEVSEMEMDELGLRRVENEVPPPSLTQLFKT